MSYQPEYPGTGPHPATDRVNAPGIFLMVVGILNLIAAGFLLYQGLLVRDQSIEAFKQQFEQVRKLLPGMIPEFGEGGLPSAEEMKEESVRSNFIAAGVVFVAALVIVFAGVRMRSFQSYGLAIAGSILALIPCISPSACCGLGIGAGIWSLVVLASEEVRAAFRAPPG